VPANRDLPVPNLFLASLNAEDYERLRPHLECVELPSRHILYEMGEPIEYCTFGDGGMTSLVIRLEDGANIEAGVIGSEGFSGISAIMGADIASHTAMIQMPGVGVRLRPDILRAAMLASPAMLDLVLRYSQALNVQISQTAACNAHHNLMERLARWLLMAHDRAKSDALSLTQEFMSMMLAVRRSGVTVAARSLQVTGAISYERGRVTVLDRARLEETSCECYAMVREQYRVLLGWVPAHAREER
jgi:CRP-like cAMP-binding protein